MNEENKSPILFPIELLDLDICTECPEMSIENNQVACYSGDKTFYCNRLRCVHLERCRRLKAELSTHEKHAL